MYKTFENLCSTKGVTPYRVAKDIGIANSTLYEWKSGKYTPKMDKLMKIAQYFGVPLEVFVTCGD